MSFYDSNNLSEYFSGDDVREQTADIGDVIFRMGEPVSRIFFVVSGAVRAEIYLEDGTAAVFFHALPGQVISEEGLHLAEHLYSAVVSVEDTVLRSVSRDLLKKKLYDDPAIMEKFIQCLSSRYSDALMYRELLSVKSAEKRLLIWLRWQVNRGMGTRKLNLGGKMGSVGPYLGLSREAIYRAFKALEDKGKISRDQGLVTVFLE